MKLKLGWVLVGAIQLVTIHQGVSVLSEVKQRPTQPPQVLGDLFGGHSARCQQNPLELALCLILQLLQ